MAGQPTKYNDEVLAQAIDYLEDCPDIIPSAVGLAVHLKVSRKTLYNWADKEENEEFANVLELINDAQHHKALNNGLSGDYNATITKLVLANHGYHEKQEIKQETHAYAIVSDEVTPEEWEADHSGD